MAVKSNKEARSFKKDSVISESLTTDEIKVKEKKIKVNKRRCLLIFPNAPIGDGTVAFKVPVPGQKVSTRKMQVLEDRVFPLKDGYYEIPNDLSQEEKTKLKNLLIKNGFREVDESDPYFSTDKKRQIFGDNEKYIYSLIHPSREKEDEQSSEYLLQYNDADRPVQIKFVVLKGVIKTSNSLWADMLQGQGFILDKKHKIE